MESQLGTVKRAPIWKYLRHWWAKKPDFAWVPVGGSSGYVDLVSGIALAPKNGAVVVPGGIVNPVYSATPVMLQSDRIFGSGYNFGLMALVSGISGNQRGMILKFGDDTSGLGVAVGSTDESAAGTNIIVLREQIAWEVGGANAWADGVNLVWLAGISSSLWSSMVWPANVGASAGTSFNSPTGSLQINGRTYTSSPFTVHCVFGWRNAFTDGTTEVEFREKLRDVVAPLYRVPTQQMMRMFVPSPYYPISSAAAPSLPTLSASTYVTGSLTSTGWRPQVTAT
jgi:hypothetical protein